MPEASTAAGKGTYALGSSLVDVAMLCSLAFLSSSVCGTGGVTCALSSGSYSRLRGKVCVLQTLALRAQSWPVSLIQLVQTCCLCTGS